MTKRIIPAFEIAHFPAYATTFQDQLSHPLNADGANKLNQLISEIASAISTQNSIVTVFTIGSSDRVDIPGLDAVEKNKRELEASALRARSAEEYVSTELTSVYNLTTDQIDSSQHFGRSNIGIGSSQLTNNSLSLSEAQRAANRRVVITAFIYDL